MRLIVDAHYSTAEEIRVVVRPWIRVDGDLNRRVLDRMLGGVLAYCLIHPGVYLTKVQEKFAPAIQPFHTKELVEVTSHGSLFIRSESKREKKAT